MAIDLGSVFFNVNARFGQVDQAAKAIKRADGAATKAFKSINSLASSFRKLKSAVLVGSTIRAGVAFVALADRAQQLNNRLKAVTDSTEEFNRANRALLAISNRTGTVLASNAQLYQRLAIAGDGMNATQDQLLSITETIGNLGRISGSSVDDIKNSTRQLAQGLGSNYFRAEEFNSIIEQMPSLVTKVAKNMSVTSAELNKMVKEGRLMSKDVFAALLKSAAEVREEASKLPLTLAETGNIIKNNVLVAVDELNKQFGVTSRLGAVFSTLGTLLMDSFGRTGQQNIKDTKDLMEETSDNVLKIIAGLSVMWDMVKLVADASDEVSKIWYEGIVGAIKTSLEGYRLLFDRLKDVPGLEFLDPNRAKNTATKFEDLSRKVRTLQGSFKDAETGLNEFYAAGGQSESVIGVSLLQGGADIKRELDAAIQARDDFFKANRKLIEQAAKEEALAGTSFGQDYARNFQQNVTDPLGAAYELKLNELRGRVSSVNKKMQDEIEGLTKVTAGKGDFDGTFIDEMIKDTDIIKLQKLQAELVEVGDAMFIFEDRLSDVQMEGLTQRIEDIKEEMANLGKETGKVFMDGINASIEQLAPSISDNLVGKLFGEESSFQDIAKNFVKDILSQILQEVLLNPIANDIKSAMAAIMKPTGLNTTANAESGTGTGSAASGILGAAGSLMGGGGGILGSLASLFGGARASGGPVNPNRAFLVGENGPELFTPRTGGMIHNQGQMQGMTNNNSNSVNIVVNTPDAQSFQAARGRIQGIAESMMRNS